MNDIIIIVPTFNENQNITILFDKLTLTNLRFDLQVIRIYANLSRITQTSLICSNSPNLLKCAKFAQSCQICSNVTNCSN